MSNDIEPEVAIIGAGIGGLVLALQLQAAGRTCRIVEATERIGQVGLGINILPHASRELAGLGLEDALSSVAVLTREAVFYNRFGQFIYSEPLGREAGYSHPQFSVHRGDLHGLLLKAVTEGGTQVDLGCRCVRVDQDRLGVTVKLQSARTGADLPSLRAKLAVACDGIHSIVRKQLNPWEGPPKYSGYNMWRGTTRWEPILTGASMIRTGWLASGKLVIYPIRNAIDDRGSQLVNWVVEVATDRYRQRDWNRPGEFGDFIAAFEDWHFDWLDVPRFLRSAEQVLEFPMVDQEPLKWWTDGRVTLLGDAAHPMLPRGSNGAGQAILDARALADRISGLGVGPDALAAYEAERRPATSAVVFANRANPPDAILREIYDRTGDRPFTNRDDVISTEELRAITDRYKDVAGYSKTVLAE